MRTAAAWFERLGTALAILITLAFILAIAAVGVAVHGGYQAAVMQTGSMTPVIRVGDLALIERTQPSAVHVGDMITFAAPVNGNPLVTHRVVKITTTAAGPVFTTKGDANASPDLWSVHYAASAWKVVGVVPAAGAVFDFMQGAGGRVIIGALIFIIVLALIAPSPRAAAGPRTTDVAAA